MLCCAAVHHAELPGTCRECCSCILISPQSCIETSSRPTWSWIATGESRSPTSTSAGWSRQGPTMLLSLPCWPTTLDGWHPRYAYTNPRWLCTCLRHTRSHSLTHSFSLNSHLLTHSQTPTLSPTHSLTHSWRKHCSLVAVL